MGQCCKAMMGGNESYDELSNNNPLVVLDQKWHGPKVKISSFSISGTGIALGSSAIHQSRAYYEVVIKGEGKFSVGVSQRQKQLNGQLGGNKKSWGLQPNAKFKVEDIIGVAIDLDTSTLRFFHNGKELEQDSVRGIKGLIYPAVSVSEGAKLECNFSQTFSHDPLKLGLMGFDGIIPARDVL